MTSQHTLNLQSVLLILLPDQSFLREFPAPANHFYLTSLTMNWDGSGLLSPKALMSSQVLLTSRISLRLVRSRLLLVQLNSNFIDAVSRGRLEDGLQILHAKGRTGKILLMKPMRKARHADTVLTEAHCRAGWYLAMESLGADIGVEEHEIPRKQEYDIR